MEKLKTKHIKGKSIQGRDLDNLDKYLSEYILSSSTLDTIVLPIIGLLLLHEMQQHNSVTLIDITYLLVGALILIGTIYTMIVTILNLLLILIRPLWIQKPSTYAVIKDISNPKNTIVSIDNTEYSLRVSKKTVSSLNLHNDQHLIIYALHSGPEIYTTIKQI